jgi:hypothetical protein
LVSRAWDISSGIGPCFPLAGGLCIFYAYARGKQPMQRQLLLVQYKQQAIPILSIHNYTPLWGQHNLARKKNIQKNENHLFFVSLIKICFLKISFTLRELYAMKITPENAKTLFLIFELLTIEALYRMV